MGNSMGTLNQTEISACVAYRWNLRLDIHQSFTIGRFINNLIINWSYFLETTHLLLMIYYFYYKRHGDLKPAQGEGNYTRAWAGLGMIYCFTSPRVQIAVSDEGKRVEFMGRVYYFPSLVYPVITAANSSVCPFISDIDLFISCGVLD